MIYMKNLFLISGNGHSAGKTTLANRLYGVRLPLADALREECSNLYPNTDFHDTSPDGKTRIVLETGETIRQILVRVGQEKKKYDPTYWLKCWEKEAVLSALPAVTVDDVRTREELEFLTRFANKHGIPLTHFHVEYWNAVTEPEFQEHVSYLKAHCNYLVLRDDRPVFNTGIGMDSDGTSGLRYT